MEFSSPVKLREPFVRRISSPLDQEDSPRPLRNGVKSASLGDLQGVDLLRGFEKISSWREGSSPIKELAEVSDGHNRERGHHHPEENGFGQELDKISTKATEALNGVNGNGGLVEYEVGVNSVSPREEDSQMTDVKTEV